MVRGNDTRIGELGCVLRAEMDRFRTHCRSPPGRTEQGSMGQALGEVGGRIIGEVLVGLLERDQSSYLRRDPGFRPASPVAPTPGQFDVGDLLTFAGVV